MDILQPVFQLRGDNVMKINPVVSRHGFIGITTVVHIFNDMQ